MKSKKRINYGKVFEHSFKNSIPNYALFYRLPDPSQSFACGNLRFSLKNPFDCIIFNSRNHILYALELKTVAGKSISFERSKEEHGEIHWHQVEGLNKWNKYDGIVCGFIIEFRKIEKTVFINIKDFNKLMNTITKKSFNFDDLDNHKINYVIIGQEKVRTHYKYKVDEFLNQ